MLLSQLPREGALGRALGGDAAEWTVERELLARLVDVSSLHQWQHARLHFKGVGRKPPPPVPRPDMPDDAGRHRPVHTRPNRPRRHMTHEEMAATFGLPLRAELEEGDVDGD